MRPDFDEIRTLTKRFALIPQKVAKFVFGVFRYADLSVLGDYKLRKAITMPIMEAYFYHFVCIVMSCNVLQCPVMSCNVL